METIRIEKTEKKRNNKKIKVAAYVRGKSPSEITACSALDHVQHFDSLIKNNPDWEFAGIYADFNKSGITVKNRPVFLRMIEDAKAGKMDVILTRSITRFSKDPYDLMKYTRLLKEMGVEVRFENEMLSTMDCLFDSAIECCGTSLKEQAKGGKMAWK